MEVCVDNIQSAINAAEGGAARIELCSSLNEGGLTPSMGFFKTIKNLINIPIFVMLRPRRGFDFVYSEEEINSMKCDVVEFKNAGANGFVFGVLKEDGTINTTACIEILTLTKPLPTTFHRAFDCVINPLESLNLLIYLGFDRILTSGQKKTAIEGKQLIRILIEKSNDKIIVVPGAGINEQTASEILNYTGAKELHGSLRKPVKQTFYGNLDIVKDTFDFNKDLFITDVNAVKKIVSILEYCKS